MFFSPTLQNKTGQRDCLMALHYVTGSSQFSQCKSCINKLLTTPKPEHPLGVNKASQLFSDIHQWFAAPRFSSRLQQSRHIYCKIVLIVTVCIYYNSIPCTINCQIIPCACTRNIVCVIQQFTYLNLRYGCTQMLLLFQSKRCFVDNGCRMLQLVPKIVTSSSNRKYFHIICLCQMKLLFNLECS